MSVARRIEIADLTVKALLVLLAVLIATGFFNRSRLDLYEYMNAQMGKRDNPRPIDINRAGVQKLLLTEFGLQKTEIDEISNLYVECYAIREDRCLNASMVARTKDSKQFAIGDFARVRRWASAQVKVPQWVAVVLVAISLLLSVWKCFLPSQKP
jgi:hypothetical protein